MSAFVLDVSVPVLIPSVCTHASGVMRWNRKLPMSGSGSAAT